MPAPDSQIDPGRAQLGSGWVPAATRQVEANSRVESAKVNAENERLRREHLEADRYVRREAYQQPLVAVERFDALTSAFSPPPDRAALDDWLAAFRAAGVAVRLVESESVREARRAFNVVNARE